MQYSKRSWRELWAGIFSFDIWFKLSVIDIVSRYRRTLLGPAWHVLAHSATIIGITLLYSRILHQDWQTFVLYVSAGLTIWSLLVLPFTDAPLMLTRYKTLITAYDTPISLHIMRAVSGYFLTFLHNMVVFVAVIAFVKMPLNGYSLYFIPALVVIMIAVTGLTMILSVFGARFRDLGPAATVVTSILFLLTPVFWNRSQTLGVEWITDINPFYHFIEIARAPMLGHAPNPENWAVATTLAVLLFLAGIFTVTSNRSNIAYWV